MLTEQEVLLNAMEIYKRYSIDASNAVLRERFKSIITPVIKHLKHENPPFLQLLFEPQVQYTITNLSRLVSRIEDIKTIPLISELLLELITCNSGTIFRVHLEECMDFACKLSMKQLAIPYVKNQFCGNSNEMKNLEDLKNFASDLYKYIAEISPVGNLFEHYKHYGFCIGGEQDYSRQLYDQLDNFLCRHQNLMDLSSVTVSEQVSIDWGDAVTYHWEDNTYCDWNHQTLDKKEKIRKTVFPDRVIEPSGKSYLNELKYFYAYNLTEKGKILLSAVSKVLAKDSCPV